MRKYPVGWHMWAYSKKELRRQRELDEEIIAQHLLLSERYDDEVEPDGMVTLLWLCVILVVGSIIWGILV